MLTLSSFTSRVLLLIRYKRPRLRTRMSPGFCLFNEASTFMNYYNLLTIRARPPYSSKTSDTLSPTRTRILEAHLPARYASTTSPLSSSTRKRKRWAATQSLSREPLLSNLSAVPFERRNFFGLDYTIRNTPRVNPFGHGASLGLGLRSRRTRSTPSALYA